MGGKKPTGPVRKFGAGAQVVETDYTRDQSTDYLISDQQRLMRDQDDQLDVLGASILRTKEIAIGIGNEADEHLALLDDIDGKVDKVNPRLKNTIRRVDRIEKKSSTKILWLIICFLFLALIVLAGLAIYL
eukprot:TRINITY_DN10941_c0_g1_i1.p1 TRINITY_DN10941_c0_g1~~TRINITY_DN10941_c0_g1_i1.p1  ORF type:complete len:151 (-),score=25.96 TRINITY_DN10941_c0_g1_i1:92-484(-)